MSYPNIIEDFISSETANYLNLFLREFAHESSENNTLAYLGGFNNWGIENKSSPAGYLDRDKFIVNDLIYSILRSIEGKFYKKYQFNLENTFKLRNVLYNVMQVGAKNGEHVDDIADYQGKNGQDGECYSAILYLNDKYTGGNIKFTDIDLSLHPKPGTLIYFKGDKTIPHEVEEVMSGERCNLIVFFELNPTEKAIDLN